MLLLYCPLSVPPSFLVLFSLLFLYNYSNSRSGIASFLVHLGKEEAVVVVNQNDIFDLPDLIFFFFYLDEQEFYTVRGAGLFAASLKELSSIYLHKFCRIFLIIWKFEFSKLRNGGETMNRLFISFRPLEGDAQDYLRRFSGKHSKNKGNLLMTRQTFFFFPRKIDI